eukprot:m.208702 g.208702  ORF g.208702 m.208702 type:complete len:335 (-) comp13768_c2_seq2:42-1046(-)
MEYHSLNTVNTRKNINSNCAKGMNKQFKNVLYYGCAPWPSNADPKDFSIVEEKDNLHKGKKIVLEVGKANITVYKGKKKKFHIPGSMLLWVTECDVSKTICMFDSYATPNCVHVFGSKKHAGLYKYIMHKLGVGHRMSNAQNEEEEETAVHEDEEVIHSPIRTEEQVLQSLPLAFEAKLVGSLSGGSQGATFNVEDAMVFLRKRMERDGGTLNGNPVTLIVHKEGLRVLDTLTRSSILHISMDVMTHITTLREGDFNIFVVVAYDDCLDTITTWLYLCVDEQAQRLTSVSCKTDNLVCVNVQYVFHRRHHLCCCLSQFDLMLSCTFNKHIFCLI